MKLNEEKMDEVFRGKLGNYEVAPPASAWDGIQQKLNSHKSGKRVYLMRIVAIAAVLVLALVAGWVYYSTQTKPTRQITEAKPVEPGGISSKNIAEVKTVSVNNPGNSLANAVIPGQANKYNFLIKDKASRPNTQPAGSVLAQRWEANLKKIAGINGSINENKREDGLRMPSFENIKTGSLTLNDKELMAKNSLDLSNSRSKSKNWEVGFRVSPGYSSQSSSHSASYKQNMTYSNTDGNADVNGGVTVGYKAGKRLKVESGLYYAQNGQSSDNSVFRFAKTSGAFYNGAGDYFNTPVALYQGKIKMNSTAGVIEFAGTPPNTELLANLDTRSDYSSALLTNGQFSQVFDFVEIPLCLRYNLVDQKIGVDIIGGVSANWLVGNNVYMNSGNSREYIGKTSGIYALNYSGTLGLGIDYSLGKRVSISIEPRFSYFLNSLNKNNDVNYHPYRVGVYTGLNYNF
jgi:hypothetical protein